MNYSNRSFAVSRVPRRQIVLPDCGFLFIVSHLLLFSPPDIFDVSRIKSSDIHVLQELDGNKAASSCIVIIEW
ncbi:hypothetical protein M514_26129, partial [Trichuris suis]